MDLALLKEIHHKNPEHFIPVEVKYRNLSKPIITKGYRSFIEAYQPKEALIITKDLIATISIRKCTVHFIPLQQFNKIFNVIDSVLKGHI